MLWMWLACTGTGGDGGQGTPYTRSETDGGSTSDGGFGTAADGGTTGEVAPTASWGAALTGPTWAVGDQALGGQLGGSMAAGDPFGTGRDIALLAGYRTNGSDTRIWLYAVETAVGGAVADNAVDACPDCLSQVGTAWATASFGDLDGDGVDDWLLPWWEQAGTVSVFWGGGAFAWTAGDAIELSGAEALGALISAGDLDNDGTAELLAAGRNSATLHTFVALLPTSTQSFPDARFVGDQDVLGDVDGDGLQDVGVRLDGQDLLLLSGAELLAGDSSWTQSDLLIAESVVWLQVVGDLDGDGRAQVAWSDNRSLFVLDDALSVAWTVPLAESADGLATHESAPPRPVDVDGDGRHDLVAMANGDDAGVRIWWGPLPSGTLAVADLSADPPPQAGAADFTSHAHWLLAPVCDAAACLIVGTSGWDDGDVTDAGLVSVLELGW